LIVDSHKERIWVLSHPEGEEGYQREEFTRGQELKLVQFPGLVLSVDTILSPPLVEDLIREEQAQRRQLEQQVDEARQRADEERQRAERLAARLREMGVNPDDI
jgi:hypothetical protein